MNAFLKILSSAVVLSAVGVTTSNAQVSADKKAIISSLESQQSAYGTIAKKIWSYHEVGFQEVKSSALLQEELKGKGFEVKAGVAEIPTAFVASFGSGKPVIGMLAEFDALPGLSQDSVAERKVLDAGGPGHGCGHHLLGTGATAAAIAVKEWMKANKIKGTLRLYGTPAEEGGSGKVYMVRAGLFADVDVVLQWHPGDKNAAHPASTFANKSAKFRFRGIAAHASGAPERGRSALDGVEAMNHMVNMMREHIPASSRIHYVITKGGEAPNVVPAFAESFLYVRHPDREMVKAIFERIVKAGEGAALGTETTMDYEVIHGAFNILPNETLAKVMDKNLQIVGGVSYTANELAFAKKIQESYTIKPPLESAKQVQPMQTGITTSSSTDVGDVSWNVPTVGLTAATHVPGTASHSWQVVATSATDIGIKGMMVAAKTLALTAVDFFNDPSVLEIAKKEFITKRGEGFKYEPLLGDRKPALDYRN